MTKNITINSLKELDIEIAKSLGWQSKIVEVCDESSYTSKYTKSIELYHPPNTNAEDYLEILNHQPLRLDFNQGVPFYSCDIQEILRVVIQKDYSMTSLLFGFGKEVETYLVEKQTDKDYSKYLKYKDTEAEPIDKLNLLALCLSCSYLSSIGYSINDNKNMHLENFEDNYRLLKAG